MKVAVMPCGLLVVISGILAGGTLGFRNVMCCLCTFSRLLQCDVLGLRLLHARPYLFSTQAAVNSTRAILSIWRCCRLLLWFLFWFVAFLVFLSRSFYRLWTDTGLCMGPCSLLILPMRRLSMFLHDSLMQGRTCATTWRKPRRRRTGKK